MVGRPVFEVLTRQPAGAAPAEFDRVFQTGEIQQSEQEVTLGGEVRSFRLSKIPMRLDGDAITHVITIGEDVTDSRGGAGPDHAEREAGRDRAARGRASCTRSTTRSPPSAPASPRSRQLEDAPGDHAARANTSRSSTGRWSAAAGSSDGLLDFSRPKGQTQGPRRLNALVDETLFLLKHHQRFKRLTVDRELDAGPAAHHRQRGAAASRCSWP